MRETPQIVGIVLVRNEEKYLQRIIGNILDFCDRILIADNLSTDSTADIASSIAGRLNNKVEYHSISHPGQSHSLIQGFAGSNTWIFAVDGDELYDPEGLARLRQRIFSGAFNDWWVVFGNVLNCIELNMELRYARGYLAPPCRSMTKLYNFNAIESWNGPCPERLHGGKVVFKKGFFRLY